MSTPLWRLSLFDRKFLTALRIAPSEDPVPPECQACGGLGQVVDKATAWAVCATCRGTGRLDAP